MEHDEVAAEAEEQAETLKHQGDRLADEIESVRRAWEAKKADPSVPGARADESDREDRAEDQDQAGQ